MSSRVFDGKSALVTGGAAGIGRGLVEELCAQGARVVIADIDLPAAQGLAAELVARGSQARAMQLDVADAEAFRRVIAAVRQELGRLDYIFNNAGVALMGEARDTSLEQYRRLFEVNLMGVVHGSKLAYDTMLEQGGGHIVNVSSVAGLYTFPVFSAYSATKFGVLGFSMALRAEAHALGVKVSVICPQNIASRMKQHGIPALGVNDPDFFKKLPGSWMDANVAARAMLNGVAKNRAIIIVPFHARLLWWLYRLHPGLVEAIGRGATRMFRRARSLPG